MTTLELTSTELKLILRLRQLRNSMPLGLGIVLFDVHNELLMPFLKIEHLNGKPAIPTEGKPLEISQEATAP